MSDTLSSFGRGAAQGATAGWSDEGIAKILAALPGPQDPEGIPRKYAAGSAEDDYLNTERGANAAAAREHPIAYGAGSIAGALPSALAIPGGLGGSAAARVAASGLTGGAMGALGGAGHADGREIGNEIGKGALMGGALGLGGAAAIEGIPAMKQAAMSALDDMEFMPNHIIGSERMVPIPNHVPGTERVVPIPNYQPAGVQINRAGMLPPRPNTADLGDMAGMSIPKAPKVGVSESMIPAAEDLADASLVVNTAKANFGKASDSQVAAGRKAAQEFEKLSKPKAQNTAESMAKTVPPKRGKRPAAGAGLQPIPNHVPGTERMQMIPNHVPGTERMQTLPNTIPAPVKSLPPAAVRPPQQTVPAPAPSGTPSMRPTMMDMAPARPTLKPNFSPSQRPSQRPTMMDMAPERPTMMDMAPVRPTLKPGTEQSYKDAVLRELAEGLRPIGR